MKMPYSISLTLVTFAMGMVFGMTVHAAPSVGARYNVKMLTFESQDANDTGSSVAMVEYDNGRELPDGFKVAASVFVQTEIGAFHMYSSLTGNKGGSSTCELTGMFSDTVTVSSAAGSAFVSGILRLSGGVHRQVFGEGTMHGGDVALTIKVHNAGSTSHPKNVDKILTYFEGWGDSQIALASLEKQDIEVDKYDRLTITATQVIKTHAISEGYYVFDIANFHETSHFYIDALTADLEVISESGHDYSSPKTAADSQAWYLYE